METYEAGLRLFPEDKALLDGRKAAEEVRIPPYPLCVYPCMCLCVRARDKGRLEGSGGDADTSPLFIPLLMSFFPFSITHVFSPRPFPLLMPVCLRPSVRLTVRQHNKPFPFSNTEPPLTHHTTHDTRHAHPLAGVRTGQAAAF